MLIIYFHDTQDICKYIHTIVIYIITITITITIIIIIEMKYIHRKTCKLLIALHKGGSIIMKIEINNSDIIFVKIYKIMIIIKM